MIYGILFKPIDYYSLNKTLDSIINEKNIDKFNTQINNILSNFDFNIKSKGYKYLVEAIKACLHSPYLIKNLEKGLYPYIANKFAEANHFKIKWAIEKSINSMHRYTNKEILEKFFPNSKKLSPRFFIETIISAINN